MKLRIGGALVAVAAVLALGACAHDSNNAASSGGDAQTQYRDCLARNGVTLPSFGPRPSGFPTVRPTARPSGFPRSTAFPRPSGSARGGGFPGGGGFPQGIDASAFAKARAACASLQPSGQPGFGTFGGNRGNGQGGRNAAYRNCLSEHGVTLQDGQQPDASDPKVAAAMKTCAVLRPSPSPAN